MATKRDCVVGDWNDDRCGFLGIVNLAADLSKLPALLRAPARRKMGNVPTAVDGKYFASKKEARRYADLKLLESAGEIESLQTHKSFPLNLDGHNLGTYVSDFYYRKAKGSREWVVEDVKGQKSGVPYDLFTLKKRLMLALYGVEVREI